jgi:DNA-directed RNA polymerase specialized sigma24 family protein
LHKDAAEQAISEYATGNHRKRYISIIRRQTGFDRDAAESVFQTCLLEAWQRRADVRGESFRNYFYAILRRICWLERNKERSRRDRNGFAQAEPGVAHEFCDPDPTDKIMVDQALATVPEEDRAILMDWATSNHGNMPDAQRTHRVRKALKGRFA